jgi:hypothetical protein
MGERTFSTSTYSVVVAMLKRKRKTKKLENLKDFFLGCFHVL